MSATPDAVTETIRADKLTPGRLVLIPMTESLETVTQVRVSGSYVTVHTNGTGPEFAYQWPADDEIDVVRGVPDRGTS